MAPAVTIDCRVRRRQPATIPHDLPGREPPGRARARPRHRRAAPPSAIAEALDDRGVALRVIDDPSPTVASPAPACPRTFADVLAILLDVARRPTFPRAEIEQPRGRDRHRDPAGRRQPGGAGGRGACGAALRGGASVRPQGEGHGRRASSASTATISLAFHAAWVRPSRLTLVDRRRRRCRRPAIALAAAELDGLDARRRRSTCRCRPRRAAARRGRAIAMPGKSQADIAYGFNTIRRARSRATTPTG